MRMYFIFTQSFDSFSIDEQTRTLGNIIPTCPIQDLEQALLDLWSSPNPIDLSSSDGVESVLGPRVIDTYSSELELDLRNCSFAFCSNSRDTWFDDRSSD